MIENNTILVVEDNEIDRKVLSPVLCANYSVIEATNGLEALDIIKNKDYDISLILLDLIMPVMDGFEFIKRANEIKGFDIPILVITSDDNLDNIYKALELGATSIFPKPYNSKKILPKIKETILNYEILKLNIENKNLNLLVEDSRNKKYIDDLTGLYNQKAFLEITPKALKTSSNIKYTIIKSDFARFKLINEIYGRDVGDKLLKAFAFFLVQTLGKNAIIARWDADSFIALVNEHRDDLKFLLIKIDDFLKNYQIDINLSISYGVYIVDDLTLPVDKMCARAEYALSRSKNSYDTAAYVIYNENFDKWIKIEQAVISGIAAAIENGEIIIYYQPKYSLITQRIVGAEALVRWNHPEYGLLSPGVFIPILENNGLIHQLDYYVWDKTCEAVARWRKTDLPKIPVSVNVSRNNFYREKLWIELLDLIEKHGLTPDCINIEITESSYMNDPKLIQSVVNKFKESGLSVHMDDFGSGLSSLNILKDLVFDVLKIDLTFLKGLESNERAAIILKSIVDMNKLLDLPVVAEGIETQAQENFLRDIGCEVGQGFLFSRPINEDLFVKLLRLNTEQLAKANIE
ncbi:MAG: EAL domain-containing protein [Spirochaetaceae bacterium]|nr:EAL domain-containing protein [Spirochaetaceae bacterium]